jgi:hypothetical protein
MIVNHSSSKVSFTDGNTMHTAMSTGSELQLQVLTQYHPERGIYNKSVKNSEQNFSLYNQYHHASTI